MQNSRRSMSKNNRGYVQDAWMYVTEPPVSFSLLSPPPAPPPLFWSILDYGAWGEFIRLGSVLIPARGRSSVCNVSMCKPPR